MVTTHQLANYKNNIIKFDDVIYLNYAGLIHIGFKDFEVSNIYRHLLNCHKMRFAPDAFIFLNCLLSIKRDTRKFTQLGIEQKPQFNYKSMGKYFNLLSEERYYKKKLKKSLATDYVFCGFFTIRSLSIDLQKANKKMIMLYTSNSSYINNIRMQPIMFLMVKESYFDQNDSFYLLSDINRSHIPWHVRIKKEVYFESTSITWILDRHYKSTNIDFNSIKADQIYKSGSLIVNPNPEFITDKTKNTPELDIDYISITEAKIITVLFFVLENEINDETLTDPLIVDRMNKRFPKFTEFEFAYICRRLEKGRELLNIDKSTENFPYKEDKSVKKHTHEKDCVVIAGLAEILSEENPTKFQDKVIFSTIDSLFPNRKGFMDSTIDKRLGPGRTILGISRR